MPGKAAKSACGAVLVRISKKFDTIIVGCWIEHVIPQTVWPNWGVLTVRVRDRGLVEVVSSVLGQFIEHFPHKMAFVKCPCACRLRRLFVHVHFDWSGSHETGALGVAFGIWHFLCQFPYNIALAKCPCACRQRRLAQNETSHAVIQKSCQETSCGNFV